MSLEKRKFGKLGITNVMRKLIAFYIQTATSQKYNFKIPFTVTVNTNY